MIPPHPLLLHLSSPHLFILTLTLLSALPASTTPLPLPPTNTTHKHPLPLPLPSLTAGRDLECFNLTTPKAHPVDPTDCPIAIDLLYHDPSGVMSLQRFSHDPAPPSRPGGGADFRVPHAWRFGACEVLLTSGGAGAVDTFRLADVIVKAERIIGECPPKSKKSLGGLALVGHGQTFFVAVNGPDLAPDGGGGGVGNGNGGVEGDVGRGRGNGTGLVVLGGGGGDDASSGVAVGEPDLTTEEGLMAS